MDPHTLANLLAWSLQAAVVVLIGGALPGLFRLHEPSARLGWWRLLLLTCLLLPLLQPWTSAGMTRTATSGTDDLGLLTGMTPATAAGSVINVIVVGLPGHRGPAWITAIIVTGILARLAYLAAGLIRLRRLRRSARPLDDDTAIRRGDVGIGVTDRISQPVTFGLRSPVILLPESLCSQSAGIRRAVIEHELWHVRRRDWAWVVAEEIVRSAFWFHPAIVWVISRIQLSREEVVDELTVQSTNARRTYLEALLTFADAPVVPSVAPFARRRHLFQRMVLISKEAVMSSRRVVVTCASMCLIVGVGSWAGVSAFPLAAEQTGASTQAPPRDPRPGDVRPASQEERDLEAQLAERPTAAGYLSVANLQERRGAVDEAEATLTRGVAATSTDGRLAPVLAAFYVRQARLDDAARVIEDMAATVPGDTAAQQRVAAFYEQTVRQNPSLDRAARTRLIAAGLAAEDRVLAMDPDYVEALVIKNLLLRHQSVIESEPLKSQLVAEADTLRQRATDLRRQQLAAAGATTQGPANVSPGMPPPPPPPPPSFDGMTVNGLQPVRIGGGIRPPTKIKDVRPVYPQGAMDTAVQGVVIMEAVIDTEGSVDNVRILRSIPLLDDAAETAVRQWKFTPTLLNGAPVPVIMTVTVNFTLQ